MIVIVRVHTPTRQIGPGGHCSFGQSSEFMRIVAFSCTVGFRRNTELAWSEPMSDEVQEVHDEGAEEVQEVQDEGADEEDQVQDEDAEVHEMQDEGADEVQEVQDEGADEEDEAKAKYLVLRPLLLHHQPHYGAACVPQPGTEPHPATTFEEGEFIQATPFILTDSPEESVRWVEVHLSQQRQEMLIPPGAAATPFFLPVLPPLAKGSTVQIDGIASRPDLNGQIGTCLWHDQQKGRWNVKLASGAGMSLREACLRATASDGSIDRCLRLLQDSDPENIANTMALRQHRLYSEACGCLDLEEASLQEWMNQAHRMARHGSIPTEAIREDLKTIGTQHGLGVNIGVQTALVRVYTQSLLGSLQLAASVTACVTSSSVFPLTQGFCSVTVY